MGVSPNGSFIMENPTIMDNLNSIFIYIYIYIYINTYTVYIYIYIYIHIWANYNGLTVLPNPGIMVNKGNHPKMAACFRLVNYYNLPIHIYIYIYIIQIKKIHSTVWINKQHYTADVGMVCFLSKNLARFWLVNRASFSDFRAQVRLSACNSCSSNLIQSVPCWDSCWVHKGGTVRCSTFKKGYHSRNRQPNKDKSYMNHFTLTCHIFQRISCGEL